MLAASSAPARAGCVWSHGTEPASPALVALDRLSALGAVAAAESDRPVAPAPSPCKGLRCADQPAPTPLAPSTPRLIGPAEQWALWTAAAVADTARGHLVPITEPLGWPTPTGPAVFHPPRQVI
jgi:hypothetical protein